MPCLVLRVGLVVRERYEVGVHLPAPADRLVRVRAVRAAVVVVAATADVAGRWRIVPPFSTGRASPPQPCPLSSTADPASLLPPPRGDVFAVIVAVVLIIPPPPLRDVPHPHGLGPLVVVAVIVIVSLPPLGVTTNDEGGRSAAAQPGTIAPPPVLRRRRPGPLVLVLPLLPLPLALLPTLLRLGSSPSPRTYTQSPVSVSVPRAADKDAVNDDDGHHRRCHRPKTSLPPPPSRCCRRRRRQRHHRRHHQPPSPHDHRWLCPTAASDDDNSHLLPHCPSPHPPLDEDATRLFRCRRGCHWRRRLRCLRRRLRLRSQDDGAKKDCRGDRPGFLRTKEKILYIDINIYI